MRRWATAALAIGLLASTGYGTLAADEAVRSKPPGAEPRAGTVKVAGQVWETEPGPNGTVIETSGIVYTAAKRAKGVKCTSFWIERSATEATITAYCTASKGNGKGKRIAALEVWTAAFDGNIGHDGDSCRDRHDIRKDPVFECTVELPNEAP